MIPVYEPFIDKDEIQSVCDALKIGEISGTYGFYLENFEKEFAKYCECSYGIAVSSGTSALHLAVAAAGIKPGDEVLISASTNIATALAVVHNGAIPIPVDSEPETWNLNPDLIESLITEKTRGIIPVHLYGHPVDMNPLIELASDYNLIIIEDAAEAHGAQYRGKKIGSLGDMGCFSFYANKIITTGEGGMVVTNNSEYAEKIRLLRNLAFSTPRFKHYELGYNFRMTGYQAAMGLAQLKKIDKIIEKKRSIADLYSQQLKETPGLQLPVEKDWAFNVYWMYALSVHPEFGLTRDELMQKLLERGIETRTFFCPMNIQPCLQNIFDYKNYLCPIAEKIWQTGLYLPSSPTLTKEAISSITQTISSIFEEI